MHDWYDWLTDIWLPLLTGGGSVVVGAVAIAVARQSHRLAKQVRADEGKRDEAARRERYRDQLFRTVEPAVTALLDQRGEIRTARRVGTSEDRNAVAKVLGHLNMIEAVANDEDSALVRAVLRAYEAAAQRKDMAVMLFVLGGLAFTLPRLLSEDRDIADLVRQTDNIVQEAIDETSPEA